MIYQVGEEYVISSGGMWLPGNYATEKAANYAFQFSDEELSELQKTINQGQGRSITTMDLREVKEGRQS